MKKLFDLVELVSNTEDAAVLKVKPGSEMDLICLGCFNGDETMFRLTKGTNHTCTVWKKNGNHYSWNWGDGGHTLVTDQLTKQGHMIKQCLEGDFDILIYSRSKEKIRNDIRRPADAEHLHTIVLWSNARPDKDCGCRKDDEFYRFFDTVDQAFEHFKGLRYTIHPTNQKGVYTIIK